jgi:hypothetical protein
VSRLTCESCGLVYSRAAIVRQMALATGVACRRCGGRLTAEEAHPGRGVREPVLASAPPPMGPRGCRLDGGLSMTTVARTGKDHLHPEGVGSSCGEPKSPGS